MPKYLTVKEVAKIFKRTEPTIRRWVKEEAIESVRFKRGIFIPDTEIKKIEDKERKGGEGK